jgi:hypothetical protein
MVPCRFVHLPMRALDLYSLLSVDSPNKGKALLHYNLRFFLKVFTTRKAARFLSDKGWFDEKNFGIEKNRDIYEEEEKNMTHAEKEIVRLPFFPKHSIVYSIFIAIPLYR